MLVDALNQLWHFWSRQLLVGIIILVIFVLLLGATQLIYRLFNPDRRNLKGLGDMLKGIMIAFILTIPVAISGEMIVLSWYEKSRCSM